MTWRAMRESDLDAVSAVSDAAHGAHTEPRAVYAERHRLFPEGCFVFDAGSGVQGYLIAHPWLASEPPAIGAALGALPGRPDGLYLHDLALLPATRGTGAGAKATQIALDLAVEQGFEDVYLLAVNGADSFWASRGFAAVSDPGLEAQLKARYGAVVYMHRQARPE